MIYLCTPFSRAAAVRLEDMGVAGLQDRLGRVQQLPAGRAHRRVRQAGDPQYRHERPRLHRAGRRDPAGQPASRSRCCTARRCTRRPTTRCAWARWPSWPRVPGRRARPERPLARHLHLPRRRRPGRLHPREALHFGQDLAGPRHADLYRPGRARRPRRRPRPSTPPSAAPRRSSPRSSRPSTSPTPAWSRSRHRRAGERFTGEHLGQAPRDRRDQGGALRARARPAPRRETCRRTRRSPGST